MTDSFVPLSDLLDLTHGAYQLIDAAVQDAPDEEWSLRAAGWQDQFSKFIDSLIGNRESLRKRLDEIIFEASDVKSVDLDGLIEQAMESVDKYCDSLPAIGRVHQAEKLESEATEVLARSMYTITTDVEAVAAQWDRCPEDVKRTLRRTAELLLKSGTISVNTTKRIPVYTDENKEPVPTVTVPDGFSQLPPNIPMPPGFGNSPKEGRND